MLLDILREDDTSLPRDKRTLCKVKKTKRQIFEMGTGKYLHIGLGECLKSFISKFELESNELIIDVCTDGVPIANNSAYSLWPILINVVGYDHVQIVGTYYGVSKPANFSEFFKMFVDEYLSISENGLFYENKKYSIMIRVIIADAPARAYLLNVPTFSGYNSCHKCHIKGLYILHRVTFPNINCQLRTDDDFKNKTDNSHHNSTDTLEIEKLPIGCVSNVPIDYMHAVLLGVVQQLLYACIVARKKPYSIKKQKVRDLSSHILSIGPQLASEFSRKPRSFIYLKRFKATDFRQLILYTLPVMLESVMKSKYYNHFLKLHAAIRILCSQNLHIKLNLRAKK